MLKCVEGVYRKGKIELAEKPSGIDEARVIVTFLPDFADRYLSTALFDGLD